MTAQRATTTHEHLYRVVYTHPDGTHWEEEIHNTVPNAMLNQILDDVYKTKTPKANYYVGLVTGPGSGNTYAAADTMASHAGWTEATPYSNSTRPVFTAGTVASQSVDNSGSAAVFNCNASATVAGCFLSDSSTKSGATGLLAGVGNFTGGDRSVASGGTLTVTVTATAASA